jgi:DNA repair protein RadA/Sms
VAKIKSKWICQQCGFQSSAFLGRCTDCSAWNSLVEEVIREPAKAGGLSGQRAEKQINANGPVALKDIKKEDYARFSVGLPSLDEVLGGGIVPGSVILLAGDPGIGKSTLLLQIAKALETKRSLLYVSAEESAAQVGLRADRLDIIGHQLYIDTQQDVLQICEHIQSKQPGLIIVDSIQAVYHPDIGSAPGSVSQVRQAAEEIINCARLNNIAAIIVGHINKEGVIAGPKVLEHMVDVVLQFEGDKSRQFRILRAIKNRYGSTAEVALFSMNEAGLNEVNQAGAFFLGDHLTKVSNGEQLSPGTAIVAYNEGNQALFLEVQALVGPTVYSSPRRVANGWDYNRLLQIIAVLEKKIGLSLARHDVYVNVVGGLDFNNPVGDLGVSMAIVTSFNDKSVPASSFMVGEIGLTGEIRSVGRLPKILKEASRLGFKQAIIPKSNLKESASEKINLAASKLEIIGVASLQEALHKINSNKQKDVFIPPAKQGAVYGQ